MIRAMLFMAHGRVEAAIKRARGCRTSASLADVRSAWIWRRSLQAMLRAATCG